MILDELYFRNCENDKMPFEYENISNKMKPYEEKIRQTLGFSFLDEYIQLYIQLSRVTEKQCFRSGVQYALRFLLEGLL